MYQAIKRNPRQWQGLARGLATAAPNAAFLTADVARRIPAPAAYAGAIDRHLRQQIVGQETSCHFAKVYSQIPDRYPEADGEIRGHADQQFQQQQALRPKHHHRRLPERSHQTPVAHRSRPACWNSFPAGRSWCAQNSPRDLRFDARVPGAALGRIRHGALSAPREHADDARRRCERAPAGRSRPRASPRSMRPSAWRLRARAPRS